MPLSDSEQKILSDLEESLTKHDPRFARSVGRGGVAAYSRYRVGLSIAGFIVGVAIMVVFLTHSIVLSLIGVLMMLCSSLVLARNAELKGRAARSSHRRSRE
jgi:hypothetical protein